MKKRNSTINAKKNLGKLENIFFQEPNFSSDFDEPSLGSAPNDSIDDDIDDDDGFDRKTSAPTTTPSTSAPPKLPPPGGDVPPYMLKGIFSQQQQQLQFQQQQQQQQQQQPSKQHLQLLKQQQLSKQQQQPSKNKKFQQQTYQMFDSEEELESYEEEEDFPGIPARTMQQPKQKHPKGSPDLNPLSKLMSPLRDILPKNWFQNEDEVEAELPGLQPQRSSGTGPKNSGPQLFPGSFLSPRNEKRKSGRTPPNNFPGPSKIFPPQKKFGPNSDPPPMRPGQFQHRGPSSRSQKGQNFRNKNDPMMNFSQRQSQSFSDRKIFRPETIPEIRASAATLPASLVVDSDDVVNVRNDADADDDDVSNDDDMEVSDTDVNDASRREETTLRNFVQELADLATSPAADVTGFDSQASGGIAVSRKDEVGQDEYADEDYEEDEPDVSDRATQTKLWPSVNETPMDDLMQPMDSERKLSVPKPGANSIEQHFLWVEY